MPEAQQATGLTLREAAAALAGRGRAHDPDLRRVRQAFAAQLRRAGIPPEGWDALRHEVAERLRDEAGADASCSVSFACARVGVLTRSRTLDASSTRSSAAG